MIHICEIFELEILCGKVPCLGKGRFQDINELPRGTLRIDILYHGNANAVQIVWASFQVLVRCGQVRTSDTGKIPLILQDTADSDRWINILFLPLASRTFWILPGADITVCKNKVGRIWAMST